MKENDNFSLPVIGRIQHGEQILTNGKKSVKDYGYFIAKIQEQNMQPYLDKFNNLFKKEKSLDIQFLDDDPLSIKRVRYNQSGTVCYCMDNENTGKQKVNKKWESVECNSNCQYLQKDSYGKSPCNRLAWLKFFIPQVSTDRIWLMRITGQQSINNLNNYIRLQKARGNSLKGTYSIFLRQEEQTNSQGKTFNNYILDIMKKEDFSSEQTTPKITKTSTESTQTVENTTEKEVKNTIALQPETAKKQSQEVKTSEKATKKETTPKTTKGKSKKTTEVLDKPKTETDNDNLDNCYILLSTSYETITNKGKPTEYLVGQFTDMKDVVSNIVIKPENAEELLECELGTVVKLDVQEKAGKKFAVALEFIQKNVKKVAA